MIKYIKEKEGYELIKYSDLLGFDEEERSNKLLLQMFSQILLSVKPKDGELNRILKEVAT